MATLDASKRIGESMPIETELGQLRAYVPLDLPFDPPLQLDPDAQALIQEAYLSLGRLDGAAASLPDRDSLVYFYLRKEAVLSSQIEGTTATLDDFIRLEEQAEPTLPDDRREMLNYIPVVDWGLAEIGQSGPTPGFIVQLHDLLLAKGSGARIERGFRTQQNFVSGRYRFIPPPPELVAPKMENLSAYMAEVVTPAGALVRAAVAHVQFETIHPFMDGNGRVGRILITLLLSRARVLRWPLLFLSHFFRQYRDDYFQLLTEVREHGDWESWVRFFLTGVIDTARLAADNATSINTLLMKDRAEIKSSANANALLIYERMVDMGSADVQILSELTELAQPTVRRGIEKLLDLGICAEVSGRRRGRIYRYTAYMNLLNANTELD